MLLPAILKEHKPRMKVGGWVVGWQARLSSASCTPPPLIYCCFLTFQFTSHWPHKSASSCTPPSPPPTLLLPIRKLNFQFTSHRSRRLASSCTPPSHPPRFTAPCPCARSCCGRVSAREGVKCQGAFYRTLPVREELLRSGEQKALVLLFVSVQKRSGK